VNVSQLRLRSEKFDDDDDNDDNNNNNNNNNKHLFNCLKMIYLCFVDSKLKVQDI